MSPRDHWLPLLSGAAASLLVVAGMATQTVSVGSPAGGWVYRYAHGFTPHALIVAALAIAAVIPLLRLPEPATPRAEWTLVAAWLLVGLAVQASIRSLTMFSLESMFVSDGANSFYTVTQRFDAATVLSDFNRVRREGLLHAQSNMPGKPLLIHALQLVSSNTKVLPWLLVLLSNLGGVLMYVFVRELFDDRRMARHSLVLYLFVPGKLLFFPLMNTVTPVVLLGCLCLLMRWLRTGSTAWAAILGVALYALVLFEPLPLVAGLLFSAIALRAVAEGQLTMRRFVVQTAAMLLVFVAAAEVMLAATGFDLAGTFRRIGAHAVEFNLVENRRYATWVLVNLWEFAFGTGFCQVALFVLALGLVFGGGRRLGDLRTPAAVTTVSLGAILLVTDLLGVNRGEVARLWIFLSCLFQIPAAWVCAQRATPAGLAITLAASIVQTAVATSMIGFVVP